MGFQSNASVYHNSHMPRNILIIFGRIKDQVQEASHMLDNFALFKLYVI